MRCPYCDSEQLKVVETRDTELKAREAQGTEGATRRRRECSSCGRRFTTLEQIGPLVQVIRGSSGGQYPFDADDLARRYRRRLAPIRKRTLTEPRLRDIISGVEKQLARAGISKVDERTLSESILSAVKEVDPAAYVQLALTELSQWATASLADQVEKLLSTHIAPEKRGESRHEKGGSHGE